MLSAAGLDVLIKIHKLPQNKNRSFNGIKFTGKGFLLSKEEGEKLKIKNIKNAECLKNLLLGRDINQNFQLNGSKMIIDFKNYTLEDALKYEDLIRIVEEKVKPERLQNRNKQLRQKWWLLASSSFDLRKKLNKLDHFIAISQHTKYIAFVMIKNKNILPNNATVVITSDSYSILGILSSKFHVEWSKYNGSTLEDRFRYTNTTCFDTFPFPEEKENSEVSSIMKKIESYRENICTKNKHGLTTLYNQMFKGGHEELRSLHRQLDQAVAELYNFPIEKLNSKKEILKFLFEKNHASNQRSFREPKSN